MTLTEAIVSDTDILGGTPVFRGTRVPVKNLFDYLNHGDSYFAFLADFDYITEEQVQAVLEFSKHNFSSDDQSFASRGAKSCASTGSISSFSNTHFHVLNE